MGGDFLMRGGEKNPAVFDPNWEGRMWDFDQKHLALKQYDFCVMSFLFTDLTPYKPCKQSLMMRWGEIRWRHVRLGHVSETETD